MLLHGLASLARALIRPGMRLAQGESLQLRYTLALMLHALGKVVGFLGVRISHK